MTRWTRSSERSPGRKIRPAPSAARIPPSPTSRAITPSRAASDVALRISKTILDEMVDHARALDPFECCGLLAGKDGTVSRHYRITNTVAKDAQAIQVF